MTENEAVCVVNTVYGRMILSPIDIKQYEWLQAFGSAHDDEAIQDIKDLLSERPHGVIFDVGAAFGYWSFALTSVATAVWAFEPQRAVFNMMSGSVSLNGLDYTIFPQCCALGAEFGIARIQRLSSIIPGWSGGISIDPAKTTSFDDGLLGKLGARQLMDVFDEVEVCTLDSFNVGFVSFIKVDVEGTELDVLRGAENTIRKCRPLMFVEWAKSDKDALVKYIEDFGYVTDERGDDLLCLPL